MKKINVEYMRFVNKWSNEILELVEDQLRNDEDSLTQSDLQGRISTIVMGIEGEVEAKGQDETLAKVLEADKMTAQYQVLYQTEEGNRSQSFNGLVETKQFIKFLKAYAARNIQVVKTTSEVVEI